MNALEFLCTSEEQTRAVAAALGCVATSHLVVALRGEMGAGKTTFVRGLAAGLGSPDEVFSPTYTLMHTYRGRLPLAHFDAWMSARESGFLASGGAEELTSGAVCAVEWADEVEEFLPSDRLEIELSHVDINVRRVAVRARGPAAAQVLGDWSAEVARRSEPPASPSVGGPQ